MKQASIIATVILEGIVLGRVTCPQIGDREGGVIIAEIGNASPGASGNVVLDLSAVTMISSSGLGALITLSKNAKAAGGALAIFGLNSDLHKLIKITNLDRLFHIKPDQSSAINSLK